MKIIPFGARISISWPGVVLQQRGRQGQSGRLCYLRKILQHHLRCYGPDAPSSREDKEVIRLWKEV